jgi:hypothetical protein
MTPTEVRVGHKGSTRPTKEVWGARVCDIAFLVILAAAALVAHAQGTRASPQSDLAPLRGDLRAGSLLTLGEAQP